MALDVHVMPFRKWWAGQYESPMERMFGGQVRRIGRSKELMTVEDSVQAEKNLHATFCELFEIDSVWDLTVKGTFSEQLGFVALHTTRAYAAYVEFNADNGRKRSFSPGRDPSRHPLLEEVHYRGESRFKHLIFHEDASGFYLPIDFAGVLTNKDNEIEVGSAVKLLAELTALASSLPTAVTWTELQKGGVIDKDDPLATVYFGVALLTHCAKLSLKYRLPIIFDG